MTTPAGLSDEQKIAALIARGFLYDAYYRAYRHYDSGPTQAFQHIPASNLNVIFLCLTDFEVLCRTTINWNTFLSPAGDTHVSQ